MAKPMDKYWDRMSDKELVCIMHTGNKQTYKRTFSTLYERYQQKLYNFVYRRVYYETEKCQLADSICQDTWIDVTDRIKRGEYEIHKSGLAPFLYASALNKVRSYFRRKKVQKAYINSVSGELRSQGTSTGKTNPLKNMIEKESSEKIRLAVLELPYKLSQVIVCHFYKGLACRETSNVLGVSENAVRYRLKRALNKLHECLTEKGEIL